MSKQKKGKWRRPRSESEGRDKPEIAISSPEERKSQSVFLVGLDLVEKKVLLVHKKDQLPSWGLPGGGVESGESLEEALYREVRDEAGHMLNAIIGDRSKKFLGLGTAELVAVYEINPQHEKAIFVDIVTPNKKPVIKEAEEIDKVEWFSLEKIMDKAHVPHDENERDSYGETYIKESHREYILVAMRFLGCLEAFGFKEAEIEDYVSGELPTEFTGSENEVSAPASH